MVTAKQPKAATLPGPIASTHHISLLQCMPAACLQQPDQVLQVTGLIRQVIGLSRQEAGLIRWVNGLIGQVPLHVTFSMSLERSLGSVR